MYSRQFYRVTPQNNDSADWISCFHVLAVLLVLIYWSIRSVLLCYWSLRQVSCRFVGLGFVTKRTPTLDLERRGLCTYIQNFSINSTIGNLTKSIPSEQRNSGKYHPRILCKLKDNSKHQGILRGQKCINLGWQIEWGIAWHNPFIARNATWLGYLDSNLKTNHIAESLMIFQSLRSFFSY